MTSKWFIESYLGLNNSFLVRNIKRSSEKFVQKLNQPECSRFTLTGVDLRSNRDEGIPEVNIRGFINSNGVKIPIILDLKDNMQLITFNCHDEINLFVVVTIESKHRLYFCKFFCCRNWDKTEFEAVEVGLRGEKSFIEVGKGSIKLKFIIEDIRQEIKENKQLCMSSTDDLVPNGNHYNIVKVSDSVRQVFRIKLYNHVFNIEEFMCPICLRMYDRLLDLKNHINFGHLHLKSEFKSGILHINKSEAIHEDTLQSKEFTFIRKPGRRLIIEHGYCTYRFGKKDIKILDYKLTKNQLQIEREYKTIDYSEVLATHLNERIPKDSIIEEEYKLMTEWNKLRIKGEDLKTTVKSCLVLFGVNKSIIRLIEVLYVQGVLNSKEIVDILNNVKTKR